MLTLGHISVAAYAVVALTGCSGYVAPDIETFRSQILDAHPTGSPVAALAANPALRAFDQSGPAFVETAPGYDATQQCLRRSLAYGFWAGGHRYVCVIPEGDRIGQIEAFDRVAGL